MLDIGVESQRVTVAVGAVDDELLDDCLKTHHRTNTCKNYSHISTLNQVFHLYIYEVIHCLVGHEGITAFAYVFRTCTLIYDFANESNFRLWLQGYTRISGAMSGTS